MRDRVLSAVALGSFCVLAAGTLRAQSDADKQFLTTASQGDVNEIRLSELAAKRSSNPDVRAFANKMVNDHTMLEQNMSGFAEKFGVEPADQMDDQHKAELQKLGGMSGTDFDKEYMSTMVADHHAVLAAFQAELPVATDPDFKRGVEGGEKVIAKHTEMADALNAKLANAPQTGTSQPSASRPHKQIALIG